MGHSGPYKDLDLLFNAFKILQERGVIIKLIIAGNSHPNYPMFLERFKERHNSGSIKFIGYVPEERLQALFDSAHAVILPYHTCTGTSGVAHLASSYGTPIVATNTPEFRELASEGCGILISNHSPESIADMIEEIIENPFLAQELRRRNFAFAKARSWQNVASNFCDLYRELLGVPMVQPKVVEEPYVPTDTVWSEPIVSIYRAVSGKRF
jgi:glycosyltransferase involved in cell wall biosynthesis